MARSTWCKSDVNRSFFLGKRPQRANTPRRHQPSRGVARCAARRSRRHRIGHLRPRHAISPLAGTDFGSARFRFARDSPLGEMDSNHRSPARERAGFCCGRRIAGPNGGSQKGGGSYAVPMVRIHLPPAKSLLRTWVCSTAAAGRSIWSSRPPRRGDSCPVIEGPRLNPPEL